MVSVRARSTWRVRLRPLSCPSAVRREAKPAPASVCLEAGDQTSLRKPDGWFASTSSFSSVQAVPATSRRRRRATCRSPPPRQESLLRSLVRGVARPAPGRPFRRGERDLEAGSGRRRCCPDLAPIVEDVFAHHLAVRHVINSPEGQARTPSGWWTPSFILLSPLSTLA